MANHLVHTESNTQFTSTSSWVTMGDFDETVNIAGPNSVTLMTFTINPKPAWDGGVQFRFLVDGSPVGPVGHCFTVGTTYGIFGMSMNYAITGYSGTTTIEVQIKTYLDTSGQTDGVDAIPSALDVIEWPNGAEIIVNEAVTNGGSSPATNASLMNATGVNVDGTASVLLFVASVPLEYGSDESTGAFTFGIDGTPEGPTASAPSLGVNHVASLSNLFCKLGVSAGVHSFELNWRHSSGSGVNQDSAKQGIFQVIEITENAILHANIVSTISWEIPETLINDSALDTDETITNAGSLVIWGAVAGMQAVGWGWVLRLQLGLDDLNAGAVAILYSESAYEIGPSILTADAMSAASHSFQLRGIADDYDDPVSMFINNDDSRHLFVLEMTPEVVVTRRIFNL